MNKELFLFPAMEIKKTIKSPLTTEFVFEHLETGLAATWGNTFRRLLLTRVPGWAIFAVKISDKEKTIASEFGEEAILKGVKEVPSYLIFHLRQLVFQSPTKDFSQLGKVCTLRINIDNSQGKEEYVVTGKDIQGELTVLNPETYLATIAPASQLKIILYCCYHYVSRSAKEQKSFFLLKNKKGDEGNTSDRKDDNEKDIQLKSEENLIFLDSDCCPVKTVGWQVEPIVVDLDKQEERLKLTITTNGSVSAHNSLLVVIDFLKKSMLDVQQLITSEPSKEKTKPATKATKIS